MRPLSKVKEQAWVRVYRVEALAEQGGRCKYCLKPLSRATVTGDHRIAKRNGGTTSKENIVASCGPCNNAKGAMSAKKYLAAISQMPVGMSLEFWLAWSRRRIWLRTQRACTRIERAAA